MTEAEIIQRNCKRFREEASLTQEQLAQRIEMSTDAVRKWEQGRGTPGRDALAAMARAFGRSMDDFYQESPPPPKTPPVAEPPMVFALKVVDKDADPELRREAEEFLRRLNQKHLERVEALKKSKKPKKR
jgi:transcriptional regulator with XRE-family HTH domain